MLVGQKAADIFITYCTNSVVALREEPGLVEVKVLAAINVGASYGVVVLKNARPQADDFVGFLMAADGQAILARHGFSPR